MCRARRFVHSKIFYGKLLWAEGNNVKCTLGGPAFLQSHVRHKEKTSINQKQKTLGRKPGFPPVFRVACVPKLLIFQHCIQKQC